tara:strand:+ start:403 stop:1071 length:669 start_codon:yes stop_codon:yes gene_type:complete
MSDLIPDLVLQDNSSQRLPCVVLVDGSSSMDGEAINNLNEGLKVLEAELKADDVASLRVQLLIVRIGGHSDVETVIDWTDAIDFIAPTIEANGTTPLGMGVKHSLKKIEEQKEKYKQNQIPYNRPWLFIITDGSPTDNGWERCANKAVEAETKGKVVIFPIGTEGANFDTLNQFSSRGAMMLQNLNFKELFVWLSQSVSAGSQTEVDSTSQLPAANWGIVPS